MRVPLCLVLLCSVASVIWSVQAGATSFLFSQNIFRGTTGKPTLAQVRADSLGHCSRLCASLPRCHSFSVRSEPRNCTLYDGRVTARDVTSAPSPDLEESFYSRRATECPLEKGYVIIPGTAKCARFLSSRQTWPQGQALCEADGAQLLKLDDANTWAAVRAYVIDAVPSAPNFYVGGFLGAGGAWQWLDGTPVDPYNAIWAPGNPNVEVNVFCVQVWWSYRIYWHRLMDDTLCTHSLGAMCEI